ncbi:MAG: pilus assembly protein [Chloroflexota bacterium]|nr:pilus assembly protein [Chloroflexota bacterium]
MLEFALILPIILLIVFGTLDIGRIVFLKAELENAVREGARLGRVTQPFDAVPVRSRIQAQTGLANATVVASCPGGCTYGSMLTVTATLPVSIVVGLVPALPSLTIDASASVRIE